MLEMRVKRSLLFIQLVGLLASPILAQQQASVDKAKGQIDEKKLASDTSKASPATVPVILKSVRQGSFVPTSRTILTVKTEDGKYVVNEAVPNSEGVAELELAPGRYVLSAVGARDSLAFVVAPPRCTFTIQVSDSGEPVSLSETSPSSAGRRGFIGPDKILAFVFGVFFVSILLVIARSDRQPSPIGILIYRVVLALAAAGIGAVIPGMIDVNISPVIRAGGAIALFVIVYWFKPADLVAGPRNAAEEPAGKPSSKSKTHKGQLGQQPPSQNAERFESMERFKVLAGQSHKGQLGQLSPSQNAELFESMGPFKSLSGESIDRVFKPSEVRRRVTVNPPNAELDVFEDLMNLSDDDQYRLTRHVTTDAPTAKKTLEIRAWVKLEGVETEAAVDVGQSSDGRVFSIRIGFKGHVVRVGKTVQLRWRSKFPGSVALNEDYWIFPLSFYEKRPDKLVVEVIFLNIPADLLFSAVTEAGLRPLNLAGPDVSTKEGKQYFAYSASVDGPGDFYVLRWRIE
jgi:hypothetical protein